MIARGSLCTALLLATQAARPVDAQMRPDHASVPTAGAFMGATAAASAAAHAPGQAYVFLRLYADSMVARLELFLPHLDRTLGLGWPEAGVTEAQLGAALPRIREYAEARLALAAGGATMPMTFRGASTRDAEPGEYVLLEYGVPRVPPAALAVTFTPFFELDDRHRNLLIIEHDWRTATFNNEGTVSLIFDPRTPTQTLELSGRSLWRGFRALVRLGVWHIWIGFDHILFLLALALPSVLSRRDGRWHPAPSFRAALVKIVTIVTFFTLAHTVTLSLAALQILHLPSRLVEAVIAASIAAAALHNLWPVARVNEAAIAFTFGLFHGFGFATVLGDIGIGGDHLVLSLLGFNLGVELGQIAIILAVFPVLFLVREYRAYGWMVRVGSATLVAIGLLMTAERALDFNVPLAAMARGALHRITGTPPSA